MSSRSCEEFDSSPRHIVCFATASEAVHEEIVARGVDRRIGFLGLFRVRITHTAAATNRSGGGGRRSGARLCLRRGLRAKARGGNWGVVSVRSRLPGRQRRRERSLHGRGLGLLDLLRKRRIRRAWSARSGPRGSVGDWSTARIDCRSGAGILGSALMIHDRGASSTLSPPLFAARATTTASVASPCGSG